MNHTVTIYTVRRHIFHRTNDKTPRDALREALLEAVQRAGTQDAAMYFVRDTKTGEETTYLDADHLARLAEERLLGAVELDIDDL